MKSSDIICFKFVKHFTNISTPGPHLTAVFFETGAMSTPTKSQNVTNCGSGGLF